MLLHRASESRRLDDVIRVATKPEENRGIYSIAFCPLAGYSDMFLDTFDRGCDVGRIMLCCHKLDV